jgi:hypothetical protein
VIVERDLTLAPPLPSPVVPPFKLRLLLLLVLSFLVDLSFLRPPRSPPLAFLGDGDLLRAMIIDIIICVVVVGVGNC